MPDAGTALCWWRVTCRVTFTLAVAAVPSSALAADRWIEVKSPNVRAMSSASDGETRTLVWQLEQIRAALTKMLPWAQVDLDRPLNVLAVKNEQQMRALVPEYWERRDGVRPASVWVNGAEGYYLAIRTDQRTDDTDRVHLHVAAYFSYISLIVQHSVAKDMPHWFTRGLAGVLSNTLVRDTYLFIGSLIPWHLEYLRERTRLPLAALVSMSPRSGQLNTDEGLERFDAQAWAFVHFLMFADSGARMPKINQFFQLVSNGTAPDVAMNEALGAVNVLERDFVLYINQRIFAAAKMATEVAIKREGFPVRRLSAAEAASSLALFHTARARSVQARAQIAQARKAGGPAPDSSVAEGLLFDIEMKREEAQAALTRAVAEGTTNAYAYYRLASLRWQPKPDPALLVELDKLLAKAVQLNSRYPRAYALLAEVRSLQGQSESALGLVLRAVQLDVTDSNTRLTAARVLLRAKQTEQAHKAARAALSLAATEDEPRRAKELLEAIERAR